MERKSLAIRKLLDQIHTGWTERIEWTDTAGVKRTEMRRQSSLIQQLQDEIAEPRAPIASDGSKNANKSKSSEPGNIHALHFLEEIEQCIADAREEMRNHLSGHDALNYMCAVGNIEAMVVCLEDELYAAPNGNLTIYKLLTSLSKTVKRARILLGYDVPKTALADTQCDQCGGTLIVAKDASSDVLCVGVEDTGGCGRKYRRHEWAKMLEARTALVDTMAAVIYTGRPAGTLYRWASEGRIARHGGAGHGRARWSLSELPAAVPGEPLPPPPRPPAIPLPTPK